MRLQRSEQKETPIYVVVVALRNFLLSPPWKSTFRNTKSISTSRRQPTAETVQTTLLSLALLSLLEREGRQANSTIMCASACILTRLVRVRVQSLHAAIGDVDALMASVAEMV